MSLLRRSELIRNYNNAQAILVTESGEKKYSIENLQKVAKSFSFSQHYDIFLSHSYDDARIVRQIYNTLTRHGYSVYVDWIEDDNLDRGKVSKFTAFIIKNRMDNCRSLIYLTSKSAKKSVWMPWELGYMDARTKQVAIAPILDDLEKDFEGQEYLGIYPYLDLTGDTFYIHSNPKTWINLKGWLEGNIPIEHKF